MQKTNSVFTDPWIKSALLVGLVLRIVWIIIFPVVPTSDGMAYDIHAQTLADHGVYGWSADNPDANWPPGTAALYSICFKIFGHNYLPIAGLNVIFGFLIILLTGLLARLWFDLSTARLSCWLLAIYPSLIFYTTVLASELPFIVFMLAAVSVQAFNQNNSLIRVVLSAIFCSIASYFRLEGLLLPLLISIFYPPQVKWHARILYGIVGIIIVALTIAPWCLRNTKLYGTSVMMTTSSGQNFWMGNNPETRGGYMETPNLPNLPPPQKSEYLKEEAINYVMSHPLTFVKNFLVKIVRMHDRETIAWTWSVKVHENRIGYFSKILKWAANFFWVFVLCAAILGVILQFCKDRWTTIFHPAILIWAYITTIHAVTIALQDRFHYPSIPSITIFASICILNARCLAERYTRSSVTVR